MELTKFTHNNFLRISLHIIALTIFLLLSSSLYAVCSTEVNSTEDPVSPFPSTDPRVTLRSAIKCANTDNNQNTITFSLPSSTRIIMLRDQGILPSPKESQILITDNLTIKGSDNSDPASITIIGNGHRIFKTNASLTLENITLKGGFPPSTSGGGAILSEQVTPTSIPLTLTLKNTLITENQTKAGDGGGILAHNTRIIIENSTISKNHSDGLSTTGSGGGIFSSDHPITVMDSVISDNFTTGDLSPGGGIFSYDEITLTNTEISRNNTLDADSEGGGIWTGSKVTLNNSKITDNSTTSDYSGGGGVWSDEQVILNNSTVTGNSTTGDYSPGGGINTRLEVVITGSTISKNTTAGINSPGGGIRTNSKIEINQSTITDNNTLGDDSSGGGIFVEYDNNSSRIRQSTISNNSTKGVRSPGGGLSAVQGHFEIFNSTIANNYTNGQSSNGAGIRATSMLFSQSTLSGNTVNHNSSSGGGAYLEGFIDNIDIPPPIYEEATEIIQSTITNNRAPADGVAGIRIHAITRTITNPHSATISNTIITGNTSGNNPGYPSNLTFFSDLDTNKISFIHSIIGNPESFYTSVIGSNTNSIFNTQVALLPLNDNGGPTQTHLLDTSNTNIAVDAGDNTLAPATFDQRGTGFDRIINTTVDIGSTEAGATPPALIQAVCVPD